MDNESIISKLLPRSLIDKIPEPELKGLQLMAKELSNSDIFEIDDEYNIHTMYQDVKVTLHVLKSVTRRLQSGDRHLSCSVEFWDSNICILVPGDTPATDDCLVFLYLAKYGWREDMVPRSLFRPMKEMIGMRARELGRIRVAELARLEAIQAEERARAAAEEAAKKKRLEHERKKARLRSTEKEEWEWILSHFTTEKGVYIPDYY
tara:strand:+ start:117 stop:734 length:618 start_codon:yes stop_codon:yes gene_type:complete